MLKPAALCSPEVLLASFLFLARSTRVPYLLCGPSGSGKTTWLLEMLRFAQQAEWQCGGLISPPVFENNHKTAIELLDAASGERRRLAQRRPPASVPRPGEPPLGWIFQPETLNWGNQQLLALQSCDLLFIDELGPLEWQHNQGLQSAFLTLERSEYRAALITIRPGLLPLARQRWPRAQLLEFTS